MRITSEQINQYREKGFLLLPDFLRQSEIAIIKSQLPSVFAEQGRRRVNEKDGVAVRSVYGAHTTNEIFNRLTRLPRLVEPARQILGSDVYVYQFKVNAKHGFGGDLWEWHQDYIFWNREDGMPSPRVMNIAIFVDEVNEFNGPVFLIPGSHKHGMIETQGRDTRLDQAQAAAYSQSPDWIANLTAKLKYSLDKETVGRLARRHGMVAPKGPAGSALFFDSNLAHGSPNNISPFDRVLILVTFNSVENKPVPPKKRRPDFLASRACEPIVPLVDDTLLEPFAIAQTTGIASITRRNGHME
jgi:L-proline 4-hydroxylase